MVPGTFIWRQWISPCQLLTHGVERFSQLSAYRQLSRSRASYPAAFGPTSQQSRRPGVPTLTLIIKSASAKARAGLRQGRFSGLALALVRQKRLAKRLKQCAVDR